MINVLFVCIGNICRSPLAEGIFEHKVRRNGWGSVLSCDSAGIAGYHIGSLPHHYSREVARRNGIELNHKARKIEKKDFERFQYILTMEDVVHSETLALQKRYQSQNQIEKMRSYDPHAGNVSEVPDPYYYEIDFYEEVYEILDRSTDALLAHLALVHNLK
jgi:protein-tyrosine phosphatase